MDSPTLNSPFSSDLPITPMLPSPPSSQRRSSTRSIKRKKFDDELVESSLARTERAKMKTPFELSTPNTPPPIASPTVLVPIEKKKSSFKKRQKKSKHSHCIMSSTKDLGRWKAEDDWALINGVQRTNSLSSVHVGVKFSNNFSLKEIRERWYALLYDPVISKIAVNSIKMLHSDVISQIACDTLFSKQEEKMLSTIAANSSPTPATFQVLMQDHTDIFHPLRTKQILYNHWLLMKQYHLLPDQTVQPLPKGDHVLSFSDAEDLIDDEELKSSRDEVLEAELFCADRKQKQEIRRLEQEVPKWQVLVDNVTGISPADFDGQTLAVLRGRLVRYLMRSKEITLGRATKDNQTDVDLSLEGPAWKISRRQGIIKLRNNGEFVIANQGKRPIYIDGRPLLEGRRSSLSNSSVIEISCLRFIFSINRELINLIKSDSSKS